MHATRERTTSTSRSATSPQVPLGAPSAATRLRMQRTKQRDTACEIALRRILHGQGLRYRVDKRPLATMRQRADILFTKSRVAVFVDGCFWHRCPQHGTMPKSNGVWWQQKLQANVDRDDRTRTALEAAGWVVMRIWEHEDPQAAAARILHQLAPGRIVV